MIISYQLIKQLPVKPELVKENTFAIHCLANTILTKPGPAMEQFSIISDAGRFSTIA